MVDSSINDIIVTIIGRVGRIGKKRETHSGNRVLAWREVETFFSTLRGLNQACGIKIKRSISNEFINQSNAFSYFQLYTFVK